MERKNKASQYKEKNFWSSSLVENKIEKKEEPIIQIEEETKPVIQIETKPFEEYNVHITYPLRVRSEPNENAEVVFLINNKNVTYRILEENNGFGKLAKGQWIMLKYTERED